MTRVLITGMSGVGKSSVVAELRTLGYVAIDTDDDGWSSLQPFPMERAELDWNWNDQSDLDWVWDENRVRNFLERPPADVVFIVGVSPNQGKFRHLFEHVILLSAPTPLIVERLRTRTTNNYGKTEQELADVLTNIDQIEPLLRASATLEIDTSQPLYRVVDAILRHIEA